MTTITKTRLDKRLRPAKIIGIILFILSIVGFAGNVAGGLMSIVLMPLFNQAFEQGPVFSDTIDWIFKHYTVCALSFSVIWIPLFFSARALYRFKEWGRIVSIIMLFLLMIVIAIIAYTFTTISIVPMIMRVFWVFAFAIYVAVLVVAVYFLARQNTRDGIRDFNKQPPDITTQISE
jgi:hypothetical protein